MAENKIKYGLKNCYYALVTETQDATTGAWTTTYGTPKALPGAVSISLDPTGNETSKFFADDTVYATTTTPNEGYEGELELARIPDAARVDIFGNSLEATDKTLAESGDDVSNKIALLFQFAGDKNNTRFVLYNVTLGRPALTSQTKADSIEPVTDTCALTAVPRADADHRIKDGTTADTPEGVYNAWFDAVYVRGAAAEDAADDTDENAEDAEPVG